MEGSLQSKKDDDEVEFLLENFRKDEEGVGVPPEVWPLAAFFSFY